ncbi:MAG: hypothetical protein M1817_004752 [Caeruleum heppii]|nr:MAG: hypothetical protein M1817_004752 [Caeruleum heppii]
MSTAVARPRSALRPTSLETLLLSLYPLTLLLGSLFSLIDPVTRATEYNAITQSHESPPSYFARKRNIFNVLFVKIGWFWTTLAFVVFLFPTPVLTPRRTQGLVRYGLLTLYWTSVTQWFFGPPLIDRGFVLTGGVCDRDGIVSGTACKAIGGQWKGGHDISGHVFILVLSSAFLWMEVSYALLRGSSAKDERLITTDQATESVEGDRNIPSSVVQVTETSRIGVKFALGVAGLSWWMLLMTAAYFHTWFEKFSGLVVALGGIFVVYYLPRGVPALRRLVGMPGL